MYMRKVFILDYRQGHAFGDVESPVHLGILVRPMVEDVLEFLNAVNIVVRIQWGRQPRTKLCSLRGSGLGEPKNVPSSGRSPGGKTARAGITSDAGWGVAAVAGRVAADKASRTQRNDLTVIVLVEDASMVGSMAATVLGEKST